VPLSELTYYVGMTSDSVQIIFIFIRIVEIR